MDTLKLRKQESIDELKDVLKDYDMTSITTNELKKAFHDRSVVYEKSAVSYFLIPRTYSITADLSHSKSNYDNAPDSTPPICEKPCRTNWYQQTPTARQSRQS